MFTKKRDKNSFSVLLLFKEAGKYKTKYNIKNVKFYIPSDEYIPEEIDAIIVFHSRELKTVNLEAFKNLRVIKTITAGTDHIPENYHNKYHVTGTHGPNAIYIAEHALSLALACARKLVFHTESMKKGEFHQTDKFHKSLFKSKVLILGFGPIGRYTAGLFKRTFNSHVYIFKRSPKFHHLFKKIVQNVLIDRKKLMENLKSMDVVINTLPLTPYTHHFIDEEFLSNLKKDAILINVSRGKVIKESALYEFLKSKEETCAGIDVWYRYPDSHNKKFKQNFPFESLNNIIMTPHNAPLVKGYFDNMVKGAMYQIKWDLFKIDAGG